MLLMYYFQGVDFVTEISVGLCMIKKEIYAVLANCPLFANMSYADMELCIRRSGATIREYSKDEIVFNAGDKHKFIKILIKGSVNICHDFPNGSRAVIAVFSTPGELFGEVYLFLNDKSYEHYAKIAIDSVIFKIPKRYLYEVYRENAAHHRIFLSNMLSIMAEKNYYLNKRVQLLSCRRLRQRIAIWLLQSSDKQGLIKMSLNREELADLLNTARPSLSRELMNMQEEGLIIVRHKEIRIMKRDLLSNLGCEIWYS